MNVILEPDILFTTPEIWKCQSKRDIFLENLLNILEYINSQDDINIYWSEQSEILLWEKDIHPWKQDKDFYNSGMSVIAHKLQKNIFNIEICSFDHELTCNPTFAFSISSTYVIDNFYCMLHNLVHKSIVPNILLTNKQTTEIAVSCQGLKNNIQLNIITNIEDYHSLIDKMESAWEQLSEEKIIFLIDTIRIKYFSGKKLLYDFSIGEQFIKDIKNINQSKLRIKLLKQIVKKLTLSFNEAQSDNSLKDERIGEITGRFRVSDAIRIHYEYKDSKVKFDRYYPEGKHDNGIRNT